MNGLNEVVVRSEDTLLSAIIDQLKAFDAGVEKAYAKVYALAIVFFAVVVPAYGLFYAAVFGPIGPVCEVTGAVMVGGGLLLLYAALSDKRVLGSKIRFLK